MPAFAVRKTTLRALVAVALAVLLAAGLSLRQKLRTRKPLAAPALPVRDIRSRLVDLDLRGVPLDEALSRIAGKQRLSTRIQAWRAGVPFVYLHANDLPLADTLDVLLDGHDLAWAIDGGVLHVAPDDVVLPG